MKILMFFSSGLGDTLFVAPTVLALRDIYPSAHITAVVPYVRFNTFLLKEVIGFNDIIHLKRLRSLRPSAIINYIKDFYHICADVRKQKYDMVILTSQAQLPDQYFLAGLSGANERIGYSNWLYKKNHYRFLLTSKVKSDPYKHLIETHFEIVRALKKDFALNNYIQKTTDNLVKAAQNSNFDKGNDKLLIILPGTGSQPYKRWPFGNFIEVINKIQAEYSCRIVMLGSTGEYDANLIPGELKCNPKFTDLGQKLSLPQIIDLFKSSDLVFGNDSGLLHLAEFLDVPTIGIYAGNWEFHSKKFLDNDSRHVVLPQNRTDELADYYRRKTFITSKAVQICKNTLNQIHPADAIARVNKILCKK
ncbi:MAG: glycosyltransferase family 9 protein [Phycisphaerales bacterium]